MMPSCVAPIFGRDRVRCMVTKRLDEAVRRRLRAGRMLLSGKTPAEAAHAVGVARQTAYTWKAVLDEGGIDALRAMPSRGRPARLDDEQLQALGRALLQSPTEHGFGSELWTLKRVGVLIERVYGVKFAARPRSGASWVRSAFRRKSPSAVPSSATKVPCRPGSARRGPGSKKSPPPRAADRLRRRVGHQRAAHAG